MSNPNESIIFEIDFTKSIEEAAQLTRAIAGLKDVQSQFAEQAKLGNVEAAKSYEEAGVQIRNLEANYRGLKRQIDGNIEANKTALDTQNYSNNSIKQNRELLRQLTEQYIQLKNPSKEATDTIKRLSDTLKQQEAAIGDNRRSVGSYKESIIEAAGSLNIFGVNGGTVVKKASEMKDGFIAAGGGLKGFNAVISANPFLLFIPVMQSVTNLLERFEPLVEAIERKMAGLSAAGDRLAEGALKIGAAFQKIFSGDFIKGAHDLTAAINGTADTMMSAAKAAEYLKGAQQDLEDQMSASSVEIAQNEAYIQKLIAASKDHLKTDKERMDLLERAGLIERENYNIKKQNSEKERDIALQAFANEKGIQLELLQVAIGTNTERALLAQQQIQNAHRVSDAEITALREKNIASIQLAGEHATMMEKINNRESQLADLMEKDRQTKLEKRKADQDKQKQEEEQYQIMLGKMLEEFFLNERQKLAKSFDDKQALIKGNSAQEVALQFAIHRAKLTALAAFDAKAEEARQTALANKWIKERDENAKAIATLKLNADLENGLIRDFGLSGERIQDEFARSGYATFAEFEKAKRSQLKETAEETKKQADSTKKAWTIASQFLGNSLGQIGQIVQEASSQRIADLQDELDHHRITQKQFDQETKASKIEAFNTSKALKITEALMTTAQATISAFNSGAEINVALGFAMAAIAGALGATQVAFIARQQPPKFEHGGEVLEVGGKPHSSGGTKYYGEDGNIFEVERNEKIFVMNRTASQQIGYLSSINEMYGGRSWTSPGIRYAASGGVINMTDGGFTARQMNSEAINQIAMQEAIRNGFKNAPAPQLSITELERAQTNRNKAVSISSL